MWWNTGTVWWTSGTVMEELLEEQCGGKVMVELWWNSVVGEWNSVVEQWNSDGGAVLLNSRTVMVEKWNSFVQQCCGTVEQ